MRAISSMMSAGISRSRRKVGGVIVKVCFPILTMHPSEVRILVIVSLDNVMPRYCSMVLGGSVTLDGFLAPEKSSYNLLATLAPHNCWYNSTPLVRTTLA